MTDNLIFQIYYKTFANYDEINEFLQQFPGGELEPISIEPHNDIFKSIKVHFKAYNIWTSAAIKEYELNS